MSSSPPNEPPYDIAAYGPPRVSGHAVEAEFVVVEHNQVADTPTVGDTIAWLQAQRDRAHHANPNGWSVFYLDHAISFLASSLPARRAGGGGDEIKRLQATIERERTWSSEWITRVRAEIRKRRGISQSRGSYEWDDDNYMKEFGWALDAIESALDKAVRDTNCRSFADCPTTQEEVDAARSLPTPTPGRAE